MVATIPLPGCDPHLEWSLRYGNPEAVRFSAASVVETFEYLLSDNINMTEATRRLRVLRAAVREHVSGVAPTAQDPKRLVCASTCMDAKFHGKPCECYPQPRNGHPAYGVPPSFNDQPKGGA